MAEETTLLAHLAHRIAGGTENAAVEALAYILNKSKYAKSGFHSLIVSALGVEEMEACSAFQTQVTAEDNSRPDFVGFDKDNEKRVIGEAKFWAALGESQGRAYLEQLSTSSPAVLLFVVPEARIDRLWNDVMKDIENGDDGNEYIPFASRSGMRGAKSISDDKYTLMMSWRALLAELSDSCMGEPAVQADIRQLQGLVERMDSEEVQPISKEQLSPEFPRLMLGLIRLVDDALDQGQREKWIMPYALNWSKPNDNYSAGWNLRISGSPAWFGIYYDLWAKGDCHDSPLWLHLYELNSDTLRGISTKMGAEATDEAYFPIVVKTGALYEEVLSDVIRQLRVIADAIDSETPAG